MQPVKDENIVDKKMGMKSVKNIAKPKKDADAKKEPNTIPNRTRCAKQL